MDSRTYCLQNSIPAMSFALVWDAQNNRKQPSYRKGWNSIITAANAKDFIDDTLNGFSLLTGRRVGSDVRYVVVDTDDTKATNKAITIPVEFKQLLEQTCAAIEKTPNGTHYYYKLKDTQDDFVGAQDVKFNNKKMYCVDLLANNSNCIMSPTKYKKPSGVVEYAFIKGDMSTIDYMPDDLYNGFLGKVEPVVQETDPEDPDIDNKKIDFVRECVGLLPESVATDYSTWMRIGMFLKASLPDEVGFAMWDEFSKKSPSYDPRGVKAFWRSAHPNGSVRGGTLMYYVRLHNTEEMYNAMYAKMCRLFRMDSYAGKKMEFEEEYFYCMATQDICCENKNGTLDHFSTTNAAFTFAKYNYLDKEGKMTSFIPMWLKDPKKRCVRRIVNTPKLDTVADDEYNMYKGWLGSRANGANETGLERFLYLVRLNAGFDDASYEYILDWYALLLQKPWVLPLVCMIFISEEEGCGKDTVPNFIGDKLLGRAYYANIGDAEQELYDTHSTAMLGTFLQKLEEASATANKARADKLKGLITRNTANINEKNVKKFPIDAYPHFVMTTNNLSPVKMSETARRFALFKVSAKERGNTAFWNETYKLLDDEGTVASVYKYFMERDINEFAPKDFPECEYLKDLKESAICPVKLFLQQWKSGEDEWLNSSMLHDKYTSWCHDEKRDPLNVIAFGRRIAYYKSDGLYETKYINAKKHHKSVAANVNDVVVS